MSKKKRNNNRTLQSRILFLLIIVIIVLIISIAYFASDVNYISHVIIPYVIMPLEKNDYKISASNIIEELEIDELSYRTITIYNAKDDAITLSFSIDGNISSLVELDEETTIIESNSNSGIMLRFFGNFIQKNTIESVFKGNLIISGDIDEKIPLSLILYDKERKPVEALLIELSVLQKNVNIGSKLQYKLDLHNLISDMTYDIVLTYSVNSIGSKGNDTYLREYSRQIEEKRITMENSFSLLEEIPILKDFNVGDYSLNVEASYLNFTSITSTLFSVKKPFYMYTLFGKIPVWSIFVAIIFLALVFLIFRIAKRMAEKKKRFHAQMEYKSLPHEGDRSLFIGKLAETDRKAYIDMDNLTVHTIVAGSTGSGKSIAAQDIIEECLMKKIAVLVFDPTAQWSGMLRKCNDKKFLSLYSKFGLKLNDARAFNGNIKVIENLDEDIDLTKYMIPGEIHIFVVNRLKSEDYDIFVANTIKKIFHSNLHEVRHLKVLIVYDEIHRILKKFGGTGVGFVQIERACREFRKWGVGLMLISQVLADFVGQIKANINTEIQMKTRDESDLDRIKMKYGREYVQSLVKAPIGSGMIQNSAWNKGIPYYITFRPILHSKTRLSEEELDNYKKFNKIVDDLEYQLTKLEKLKQDVFDLRLELKLAKNKIKTGNFNIVQIYLDSLIPRVKKVWDKIGRSPKKKEEDDKVSEGKTEAVNEGEAKINNLIEKAHNSLKNKNKKKAKEIYFEILELYKAIPPELKEKIYKKAIELNKKINGKND